MLSLFAVPNGAISFNVEDITFIKPTEQAQEWTVLPKEEEENKRKISKTHETLYLKVQVQAAPSWSAVSRLGWWRRSRQNRCRLRIYSSQVRLSTSHVPKSLLGREHGAHFLICSPSNTASARVTQTRLFYPTHLKPCVRKAPRLPRQVDLGHTPEPRCAAARDKDPFLDTQG